MGILTFRHRLWLEADQPVKEMHQHIQGLLLAHLYHFAHFFMLTRIILKLEVPPLECYGVVEEKLRSAFQRLRDGVLGEVPREGARDIGKHEGNVFGHGIREDGG